MAERSLLVIVQPDFLHVHVGVRRVILYYIRKARDLRWDISIARFEGGRLLLGSLTMGRTPSVRWGRKEAEAEHFDTVLLTVPWVAPEVVATWRNAIGIVYDLAPNLIAANTVTLGRHMEVYNFAFEHSVGFVSFTRSFGRVLSISESTAHDFQAFIEARSNPGGESRVVVDIPFDMSPRPAKRKRRRQVLLVNALDWRKNFSGSADVLERAAAKTTFEVVIVGKERIGHADLSDFFERLAALNVRVRWFPWVSDRKLRRLYRESAVLLFPSRYEGLGYPILEAQAEGCPAITSDSSSCAEVNMNELLVFDADDTSGMAATLVDLLDGTSNALVNEGLQDAIETWLAPRSNPLSALTLRSS